MGWIKTGKKLNNNDIWQYLALYSVYVKKT